jgi:hypothetical protein
MHLAGRYSLQEVCRLKATSEINTVHASVARQMNAHLSGMTMTDYGIRQELAMPMQATLVKMQGFICAPLADEQS